MTLRGLTLALASLLPLLATAAEPLGTRALEGTYLKNTPPDTTPCKVDGSEIEGRMAGKVTPCPKPPQVTPLTDPKPETLLDRTLTNQIRPLDPSARAFDGRSIEELTPPLPRLPQR